MKTYTVDCVQAVLDWYILRLGWDNLHFIKLISRTTNNNRWHSRWCNYPEWARCAGSLKRTQYKWSQYECAAWAVQYMYSTWTINKKLIVIWCDLLVMWKQKLRTEMWTENNITHHHSSHSQTTLHLNFSTFGWVAHWSPHRNNSCEIYLNFWTSSTIKVLWNKRRKRVECDTTVPLLCHAIKLV